MAAPVFEIVEYKDGFDRSVFRVRRRVLWFFWEFATRYNQNWRGDVTEVIWEWLEDRRGAERYIEDELYSYKRKIRKKVDNAPLQDL